MRASLESLGSPVASTGLAGHAATMDWAAFAFGFCAVLAVALLAKYRSNHRNKRGPPES